MHGGVGEVLLSQAVLAPAFRVEQAQMCAHGLFVGPPLHEVRAHAPVDDHTARIHDEDRVVAHALAEGRHRGVDELRIPSRRRQGAAPGALAQDLATASIRGDAFLGFAAIVRERLLPARYPD